MNKLRISCFVCIIAISTSDDNFVIYCVDAMISVKHEEFGLGFLVIMDLISFYIVKSSKYENQTTVNRKKRMD